jgi:para-nitrobenzyl esterase
MTRDRAAETARRLLKALDITDPAKLADVPAQTLLDWQIRGEQGQAPISDPDPTGGRMMYAGFGEEQVGRFAPVVDGHVLPRHPFDPDVTPLAADIPLLIAHTNAESTFGYREKPEIFVLDDAAMRARLKTEFGDKADALVNAYRASRPNATPSELYIAITTARQFGNDTVTVASRKSLQPAPVWFYRWDYNANFPVKGSTTGAVTGPGHASDIGPTFDNWDLPSLHGDGPGVEAASHNLSAIWTSFARTGVPTCPGVGPWPRYETKTRPVLLVDATCKVVNDPDGPARQVWGIG